MTVRLLLALGLVSVLSACSTAPVVKPAELPGFKPVAQLTHVWDANIGKAGGYIFSPASDGESAYAAGSDGQIVKLDLASGRELWRIDTGKPLSAGVGVGEGLVLVGTPKGEVLAFKAADGAPVWNARLGGEILVAPYAADKVVAARTLEGKVWLLEADTGKVRWSNSHTLPALIDREQSDLLVRQSGVFVGYPGGRLVLLALNNGAPVWESAVSLPKGATELERMSDVTGLLALDEHQVCAAAFQGRVACFDRDTGNLNWAREVSSTKGVSMDEKQAYVADEHGRLFAYDKIRGVNSWKQDKLLDRKLSSPTGIAGRFIAVGDFEGQVHLLSVEDGSFAARAATDGSEIRGESLPLRSGVVVQTANGAVVAFRVSGIGDQGSAK